MSALVKLGHVNKTVATAGTRVQLSTTSKLITDLIVQANSGNSGVIYVGDSTVSSSVFAIAITAGNTLSLTAADMGQGGSYELDLKDLWIDASVGTDGASIGFFYRV